MAFVDNVMKEAQFKWWRRASWLPEEWAHHREIPACQLALDLSFLRSLKYGPGGKSEAAWIVTRAPDPDRSPPGCERILRIMPLFQPESKAPCLAELHICPGKILVQCCPILKKAFPARAPAGPLLLGGNRKGPTPVYGSYGEATDQSSLWRFWAAPYGRAPAGWVEPVGGWKTMDRVPTRGGQTDY